MNELKNEVMVQLGLPKSVSRRQAMQWVMAAVAASSLPGCARNEPVGHGSIAQEPAAIQPAPRPAGYGLDPKLVPIHKPGDFWPLTFDDAQKKTVTALADVIIPKDALGPAASEVGVVAMIDEWISAPYPHQQEDRTIVLQGLTWLESESMQRFGRSFHESSDAQKTAICDDICYTGSAKPSFQNAAQFFASFRSLCASAYYATPEGWKAIGYVGNIPLPSFDGPPKEVLDKLGVVQTVV